jgi:hypothetical protein
MSNAYLTPKQTRTALSGYTPARLDTALWDSIGDDVIGAVAMAEPTSGEDAKKLIEALVGFLADQDDAADGLTGLLTEDRVNLWLHTVRLNYTDKTLQQIAGRLRRMARAAAGLNPRTHTRGKSTKPKKTIEPMSAAELVTVTAGNPELWLERNSRHPLFKRVRLTCDIRTLNELGVAAAIRAGIGRRRLEEAAPHVACPDNPARLLRGI